MRRSSCLFLLAASCFPVLLSPLAAHAIPYSLEYSGHLTDRHTSGYNFENVVSGKLIFDLDFAADQYPQDIYYSEYKIIPGLQDFVTGYVAPNVGLNQDFVRFANGYNEPDNPEPFNDAFNIYDATVVDGIRTAVFVGVEPPELDWLTNDKLTEFDFGPDKLTTNRSDILFTKDFFSIGSDGVPTVRTIYEAYYQLDFAKLTAVRVPEPSSMLLFIGGVALFLSRRLRKE